MHAKKIVGLILLIPFVLNAADLAPWFPPNLEIQPRVAYVFQNYTKIDGSHCTKKANNDHFLTLSLGGSYNTLAVELETTMADTRHHTFGFADIALTGRYQWLNDILTDPVSLTTGVTVRQVFKVALNDISNFYNGGIEAEVHAAVGKETACREFWETRYWGVLGIGIADFGYPWIRANAAWERNWWDRHAITIYAHSLWGFGSHSLHCKRHFRGYGPIHHQNIDLGFLYDYALDCGGIVSLGYARRIYAKNCPKNVNLATLSFVYPFGL